MSLPYWRLSGFYWFYFASLGVLLPYWGLYLQSLGFTEAAIGNLMAIIMATRIVSPNIWGWIADHTGRRMAIVRFGSFCAALTFLGVFISSDYWWLMAVMLLFSFFWNAALPQFEATTMSFLGAEVHRYGGIRLWGSVGFISASALLGNLIQVQGVHLLPWALWLLFTGIWLNSTLVPDAVVSHLAREHEPLRDILLRPQVVGLLLGCFLMQASHGPYYIFYSIYMRTHDYSMGEIGGLWALGVIAEVLVFLLMHRMFARFSLRHLLLASLFMASLRWTLIGVFPEYGVVVLFAQILHAATFGVYHATAIHLIHLYFNGKHQGKGQALYSSLSFGAGGALGSFYSGYVYDYFGALPMFLAAAGMSALAYLIVYLSVPEKPHSLT